MPDSSSASMPSAETVNADRAKARSATRLRLFAMLGAVVLIAALIAAGYWLLIGRFKVSTDNAYVDANTAEITPQVAGQVVFSPVSDTDMVKAGQVLVRIDDSDAKVAAAEAQSLLGEAERKVRGYYANADALGGQVAARDADILRADAQIVSAQSDMERARTNLQRRERLASSGAVSGDELTQAQNQFHTATAALAQANAAKTLAQANRTAAVGTQAVNSALISGVSEGLNPEVAEARAKLDRARLDLSRTVLRAPFDGVVAKNQVAVGQRVAVGQGLMTIVPINKAFVDANFKEVQLRNVRVGQPVTLTSDYWGSGVKFHGRVAGFAGGTGAAFSLIPAQNATGNWIKVVQRLPLRIDLDPAELAEHPLRVGLSMNAVIDTSKH